MGASSSSVSPTSSLSSTDSCPSDSDDTALKFMGSISVRRESLFNIDAMELGTLWSPWACTTTGGRTLAKKEVGGLEVGGAE